MHPDLSFQIAQANALNKQLAELNKHIEELNKLLETVNATYTQEDTE